MNSSISFPLGRLVATRGVYSKMDTDKNFQYFVVDSLKRYCRCDWGDVGAEDWKSNDNAIGNDLRLMGVYKQNDISIWIITEWDRSATTILFPSEY